MTEKLLTVMYSINTKKTGQLAAGISMNKQNNIRVNRTNLLHEYPVDDWHRTSSIISAIRDNVRAPYSNLAICLEDV